jgi:hypothetical protein
MIKLVVEEILEMIIIQFKALQNFVCISNFPHVWYMSHTFHPPLYNQSSILQIMKLL